MKKIAVQICTPENKWVLTIKKLAGKYLATDFK